MKTRCSYCGDTSNIQREGNLCHSCSRGIMVKVDANELKQKNICKDCGYEQEYEWQNGIKE